MILAVDPGLENLGWAVVRPTTGAVIDLGVFVTKRNHSVELWTDRAQRIALQSAHLADLVDNHDVSALASEAISLGGPPLARLSMAVTMCFVWGNLIGLAEGMSTELYEVTPKQWQHAVMPHVKAIDYDALFAHMHSFMSEDIRTKLNSIKPSLRNHAIDAVGVGVYAALRHATPIRERMSSDPRRST